MRTAILASLLLTTFAGLGAPAAAEHGETGTCTPWIPPYTADAGVRYCVTPDDPDCLIWREQIYIWGTQHECYMEQP